MKLLFICGSLEPGRDGVGDYCILMARALRDLGVECALLAINDAHLRPADGPIAQGTLEGTPFLRLAAGTEWRERAEPAKKFVDRFQPAWVSVQFVCYAFHPRGFASGLGPQIASIAGSARVHVMFHEIWIGDARQYGLVDRAVGLLQKRCIRHLVRTLHPASMHTSNAVYQHLLAGIGVHAGRLPLPGNITICEPAPGTPATIRTHGSREWVAGIFGSIHPRWSAEPWLDALCATAVKDGRPLIIAHFGEPGAAGREVWDRVASSYAQRAKFILLGRKSAREISLLLQEIDFGLATSPWHLIEKSGATAAFLDHGVPVLVTRDDWLLRGQSTPLPSAHPLLLAYSRATLELLTDSRVKRHPESRVPEIARRFASDLGFGA